MSILNLMTLPKTNDIGTNVNVNGVEDLSSEDRFSTVSVTVSHGVSGVSHIHSMAMNVTMTVNRNMIRANATNATNSNSVAVNVDTSGYSYTGFHVVISHCDESLHWFWGDGNDGNDSNDNQDGPMYLQGYNWTTITILSKCGKPPIVPTHIFGSDKIYVISLPNVGRCDHSYTYWIQQVLFLPPELRDRELLSLKNWQVQQQSQRRNVNVNVNVISPNDLVLFMKGNNNSHRKRRNKLSLDEMVAGVRQDGGFSCGMTTSGNRNMMFVDGPTLSTFALTKYERLERDKNVVSTFSSPYRPLGKWLQKGLNGTVRLPGLMSKDNDAMGMIYRVCYRGIFMATVHRIQSAPVKDWRVLVQSLGRGDNIEEGHYMERLWAPLLSPQLPTNKQDELRRKTIRIKNAGSFTGVLVANGTKSSK